MFRADLHIHTTMSDGSMTAPEIAARAAKLGLTHIAFTDHDTTEEAEEAVLSAREQGLHAVPAVEISAFLPSLGTKAHILGYGYQRNAHIEALCAPTRQRRHQNSLWQIGVLQQLGYAISEELVRPFAHGVLYKQHIMDYLVKTGQADDLFGETFRRLFGKGGPCYSTIEYVNALDAVQAVTADGGRAVLAHPGQQYNLSAVPMLVEAGLAGIELDHRSNTAADREEIHTLCRKYGLVKTGGSDFHGRYSRPGSELGGHLADDSSQVLFET